MNAFSARPFHRLAALLVALTLLLVALPAGAAPRDDDRRPRADRAATEREREGAEPSDEAVAEEPRSSTTRAPRRDAAGGESEPSLGTADDGGVGAADDDDDRNCVIVGDVDDGGGADGDGDGEIGETVERDGYCDNQAIVRLTRAARAGAFARDFRATVIGAIPGERTYLLRFRATREDAAVVRNLSRDKRTVWAELNYVDQVPEARPRNFYRSGENAAPQPGDLGDAYAPGLIGADGAGACATGQGATVAVIDTGIDNGHSLVKPRLVPGWNVFLNSTDADEKADRVDNDRDGFTDEGYGHGTHVAGIVAQVAPRATILPIKALDDEGTGDAFYLAKAISYARAKGADVINLSIGSTRNSRAVGDAVRRTIAQGIVIVAAAGNQNVETPVEYPASFPAVLSVASTDRDDVKSDFSNFNGLVDISAPGSDIVSAFPPDDEEYRVWSGTSMATPWVAGAAALLLDAGVAPAQVGGRLTDPDNVDPVRGDARGMGAGRLNVGKAVGCSEGA